MYGYQTKEEIRRLANAAELPNAGFDFTCGSRHYRHGSDASPVMSMRSVLATRLMAYFLVAVAACSSNSAGGVAEAADVLALPSEREACGAPALNLDSKCYLNRTFSHERRYADMEKTLKSWTVSGP